MAFILETVVITVGADDVPHIAPYGPDRRRWRLHPRAVPSLSGDRKIYRRALRRRLGHGRCPRHRRLRHRAARLGDRAGGRRYGGRRLADALAHIELAVEAVEPDEVRPKYRLRWWCGRSCTGPGSATTAPRRRCSKAPSVDPPRHAAAGEGRARDGLSHDRHREDRRPREQEAWAWIADRIAQHYPSRTRRWRPRTAKRRTDASGHGAGRRRRSSPKNTCEPTNENARRKPGADHSAREEEGRKKRPGGLSPARSPERLELAVILDADLLEKLEMRLDDESMWPSSSSSRSS